MQANINSRRYLKLNVNDLPFELQVNTGLNIIVSSQVWKNFGSPKLDDVPYKVSSASFQGILRFRSQYQIHEPRLYR